ncbi:MAG: NADH-quinone oxidoreductase subunit NuoF [Mogibacterium diversum]|uniref:NADH-quinone oxidoreductase subunit NuoF n=1 Tax=Mogibacterium diversum TaxID=114527 RepID=UPI00204E4967|nr:NADH-quinone oxidoreductase subunit NuoF [Mogibacterium diversum]UQF80721.1 MAG: NADH-quinone oxidoreductase subunit NuoF [Mogibacterium diversum]
MKSLNELRAIKNKMMCQVNLRLGGEAAIHAEAEGAQVHKNYILVCGGTGCTSNHSLDVVKAFETHLKEHGLQDDVKIIQTGCLGLCAKGPVVVVHPGSVYYEEVDPEKVEAIVNEHIVGGVPTDKYMLKEETTDGSPAKTMTESDFYTKQERIALRNCGVIDPENIDEYIATGGYEALGRCLTEMTPDEVIQTVLDSGIRGRGGAGFPTGKKWKFASGNRGEVQKYVCCNADEGDPGAFMDRSILEGDPHSVFEAMAIAGYAIGADQGYIYVRAEYPIAVNRLEIALKQAREYGLIGKDIFGTGFNFDIDLRLGAGAFVCGEETALLTSIEGNRGEPHPRPPFPAVKGLFGCPTILNNVETYANIPVIFNKGPEWFSSLGTELSPGTKVFALGGKINNTGLVEVPMGTTLRDVVENIGGGVPNGKKFKAAQTGGPSGGCIPSTYYDIPIDFENLKSIGCMMGSGGLIVMDEDSCMVDIAKFFLEFTVSESCGKCTPCRVGTKRMLEILTRISEGKGEMEDLEKLEELANFIQTNSLCGLGQTAPNPVLSTMRFFRDEYVAHIKDKTCPAGVCKKLLKYSIIEEKCKGCTLCARNCPVDAISGAVKMPHVIDTAKCIKCGACMDNCRFGAIIRK